MMNGENSLQALEDIAIARNLGAATVSRLESVEMQSQADFATRMTVALKERNSRLAQLSKQLAAIAEERNLTIASAIGAAQALNDACAEIARLSGRPIEQVRQQYAREARTRHFSCEVDRLIGEGRLTHDPRETGELTDRNWYVPSV